MVRATPRVHRAREHGRLNAEVLDKLDGQPGQSVLRIGSGSGATLREASQAPSLSNWQRSVTSPKEPPFF
jgi:hypothetical protein